MLLAATMVAGCGLSARKDDAEAIRRAPDLLLGKGGVTVTVSEQTKVIKTTPSAAAAYAVLKPGSEAPPTTLSVALDYPKRLMVMTAPPRGGQTPEPVRYFNDGIIYQRRVSARPGTRTWAKLDIGALYDERKRRTASAFGNDVFNTAWILDLLRGALTGSVERLGSETVDGTQVNRFRVNYDWEKALKRLSEERRQTVETALAMMGVPARVVRGEVWMGVDGVPRRMAARIRQQRSPTEVIEWRMVLDLSKIGEAVTIGLPLTKDISTVDSINEVVQAGIPPAATSGSAAAP